MGMKIFSQANNPKEPQIAKVLTEGQGPFMDLQWEVLEGDYDVGGRKSSPPRIRWHLQK